MDYYKVKAISNSFLKNPNRQDSDISFLESIQIGSIVDALITEPDKVSYWQGEMFFEGDLHQTQITKEISDKCIALHKAFIESPIFDYVSQNAPIYQPEAYAYYSVKEKGISFEKGEYKTKAKADILLPNKGICIDLKTTNAESQEAFLKQVLTLAYHRQAVWYMQHFHCQIFVFVGLSKTTNQIYTCKLSKTDPIYLDTLQKIAKKINDLQAKGLLEQFRP